MTNMFWYHILRRYWNLHLPADL